MKIRIDAKYLLEDVDLNVFFKKLSTEWNETGILVFEKQPKEHYHVYIDACVTVPTMRKRLNEILSSTGNEAKSVSDTHHDWTVYKGYLLKYEDSVIVHIGSTYDKDELKASYEAHKKPDLESRTGEVILSLETWMKTQAEWTTIRDLARLVIKYHKMKNKLMDRHYIGKLITTLYVRSGLGEDRFIEQVVVQETPFADTFYQESGRITQCKFCKLDES